jgi:hypothetical protein
MRWAQIPQWTPLVLGLWAAQATPARPATPAAGAAPGVPAAVRVSVARADIRADPRESSTAIGAVRYGEVLPLLGVEAGWDHVTVFARQSRVDGYLPASYATPAPAEAAVDAPLQIDASPRLTSAPGASAGGVAVALDAGGKTQWISAVGTRAVPLAPAAGDLGPLAASAAMTAALGGATPMPVDPSADMTWAWLLPSAKVVVATLPRPVVTIIYNDVPGVPPNEVKPVLVRLMPAESGWRLIATARGRADEPFRQDADWSIAQSLVEAVVAGIQYDGGAGLMKIRLAVALAPGEYAVILRPLAARPLAGETVFAGSALAPGESIIFSTAWPFKVS